MYSAPAYQPYPPPPPPAQASYLPPSPFTTRPFSTHRALPSMSSPSYSYSTSSPSANQNFGQRPGPLPTHPNCHPARGSNEDVFSSSYSSQSLSTGPSSHRPSDFSNSASTDSKAHSFSSVSTSFPGPVPYSSSNYGPAPPLAPPPAQDNEVYLISFGPDHGVAGDRVTVQANLKLAPSPAELSPRRFQREPELPGKVVRILFGNKPMQTSVSQIGGSDTYSMVACAPSFNRITGTILPNPNGTSGRADIKLQILEGQHQVVYEAFVGSFTYNSLADPASAYAANSGVGSLLSVKRLGERLESERFSPAEMQRSHSEMNMANHHPLSASAYNSHPIVRTTSDSYTMPQASPPMVQPKLVRSTHLDQPMVVFGEEGRATIELQGDIDKVARGWTASEYSARRRLVQFFRRQNGGNVSADFRVITQAECVEQQHLGRHAMIVSCIFNDRENRCFITSVDLIHLIEQLVMGGGQFSVEEKNRIRRNLEGFKPQTIAKGKQSTAAFFKLIMDFPVPKPRNIEKDTKVFPWECVGEALEKIVSKYSASYPINMAGYSSPYYQPPPPQQYTASPMPASVVGDSSYYPSPSMGPPPPLIQQQSSDSTPSTSLDLVTPEVKPYMGQQAGSGQNSFFSQSPYPPHPQAAPSSVRPMSAKFPGNIMTENMAPTIGSDNMSQPQGEPYWSNSNDGGYASPVVPLIGMGYSEGQETQLPHVHQSSGRTSASSSDLRVMYASSTPGA